MLDAIGGFDDADEQIPLMRIEPLQDDLRTIVEGAIQVVHERLLVDPILVQRPRGFGPSERTIGAEPLVERGRERRRRRHGRRRIVRLPVDWRHVQLQLGPGADQEHLRHAVDPHEQIDREIEIDPFAPLVLAKMNRAVADFDRRRLARAVPVNGERQADVFAGLELGDLHLPRLVGR